MKRIYLDNAATTAVAPEVRQAIDSVYENNFGNPSSIHTVGQEAKRIVDESRRVVSTFVGCQPEEIIFTSGGSESDNLAIKGIVEGRTGNVESGKPHIITSAMEHHAVLHTLQEMEKEGLVEVTYLKPDSEGIVSTELVKAAIKDNTILVTLIYVNNETGVVTPIKEIGEMIEVENKKREKLTSPNLSLERRGTSRIYFHTDAVQAAEFFNINPDYLKVDLLSFTAHKIHGPKGIGALYVRKRTPLKSQIIGGDQEFRKRAGTENVAGMAGFAKALELIHPSIVIPDSKLEIRDPGSSVAGKKSLPSLDSRLRGNDDDNLPELIKSQESKRLSKLRDKLIKGLTEIPNSILNGSKKRRNPNTINVSFINAEGEAIILNLDFMGIAVSSGSACTSRSLAPSHVLTAMGVPPEKAHGSIRFSLSRYTTEEEIDKVLGLMPGIIEKLRMMSPLETSNIKS